jgi:hypothetical protein
LKLLLLPSNENLLLQLNLVAVCQLRIQGVHALHGIIQLCCLLLSRACKRAIGSFQAAALAQSCRQHRLRLCKC